MMKRGRIAGLPAQIVDLKGPELSASGLFVGNSDTPYWNVGPLSRITLVVREPSRALKRVLTTQLGVPLFPVIIRFAGAEMRTEIRFRGRLKQLRAYQVARKLRKSLVPVLGGSMETHLSVEMDIEGATEWGPFPGKEVRDVSGEH